ncbi:MAG TPA: hypothetical protein VI699_10225, partial [Candidatus Acidoferrales bacterium]|nr:hypothetical protein [Candidatus Acidoferrales bacterium]
MAARGGNPNDKQIQNVAFSETMQFACVPPPRNVRALGHYFIYKERPEIIERHPRFGAEFAEIMAPVFAAMEKGQMDALYRQYNPQLAAQPSASDDPASENADDLTVLGERIASTLSGYVSQAGTASLFNTATLIVLTKDNRVF